MEPKDPLDTWTDPTEITGVSFSGALTFSCCRLAQNIRGENRSVVQCVRCGTVYGLTLLVRLQAVDSYRFAPGTVVRLKERIEVKVGASMVTLDPGTDYEATQDTHGVLNVPPDHQPVLVKVQGDRGPRLLIAMVPEDQLVTA